MNDGNLLWGGWDGPRDAVIFRKLLPVQDEAGISVAVFLRDIETAGLQRSLGMAAGWVFSPLPVGLGGGAQIFCGKDLLINGSHSVEVNAGRKTDQRESLLSQEGRK